MNHESLELILFETTRVDVWIAGSFVLAFEINQIIADKDIFYLEIPDNLPTYNKS
jgi:hypothetical protein